MIPSEGEISDTNRNRRRLDWFLQNSKRLVLSGAVDPNSGNGERVIPSVSIPFCVMVGQGCGNNFGIACKLQYEWKNQGQGLA